MKAKIVEFSERDYNISLLRLWWRSDTEFSTIEEDSEFEKDLNENFYGVILFFSICLPFVNSNRSLSLKKIYLDIGNESMVKSLKNLNDNSVIAEVLENKNIEVMTYIKSELNDRGISSPIKPFDRTRKQRFINMKKYLQGKGCD